MAAIATVLFRGLINVAIVTALVAVTWSVYIYREPIAGTIEPVTRVFQGARDEPAREAATDPDSVAPPLNTAGTDATTDPAPANNPTTQ